MTLLARFGKGIRGLQSVLRLVLSKPHDTATPEGRAKERFRRAALSTVTSALAQALAIGTGLLSIRITIGYLGKSQYGLWMAASALLSWATLADFGLGRGVQNHLSEAYGSEDRDAAARYVSTGFYALVAIAIVFSIFAATLTLIVPWAKVLGVDDPALAGSTRIVVAAVTFVFVANFPLSLVPSIYAAHQRSYVANLFGIVGSLVSLGALLVIVKARLAMPWLILTGGGIGLILTSFNFAWIVREMAWLRPRRSLVSAKTLRSLASVSVPLLIFQLGGLVINEAQVLIVAHRIGLYAVTDFSVLMRVYSLPALLVSTIDGPMIPAFREAYVRGDRDWLTKTFWRLVKLKMVIACVGAVAYVMLGNHAVRLLSAHAVSFDWRVWLACGALQIVAIWNVSFVDLLIAMNRLWIMVIAVLCNGIVTLALTWAFSKPLGILGVVIAMPIFSAATAWLLPYVARDVIRTPEPVKVDGVRLGA